MDTRIARGEVLCRRSERSAISALAAIAAVSLVFAASASPAQSTAAPEQQPKAALGVLVAATPGGSVLVEDVDPGGPAANAGIRPGDFILSVDDQNISSPEQLMKVIESKKPGDRLRVGLWRHGEKMSREVALADRKEAFDEMVGPEQTPEGNGWLGVMLRENGAGRAEVSQVYPSGPAARAGLQAGDVIASIGGTEVSSVADAAAAIATKEPGSEVDISVLRRGAAQTLKATLGDRTELELGSLPEIVQRDYGPGWLDSIPESAMMLEQQRRLAEQHQRLENMVQELKEQVRALRQEVQELQKQAGKTTAETPKQNLPAKQSPSTE